MTIKYTFMARNVKPIFLWTRDVDAGQYKIIGQRNIVIW